MDKATHKSGDTMRGVDPSAGEADYSGSPRASQWRKDWNRQPYLDGEGPLVSSISSIGPSSRNALGSGAIGGPELPQARPQPAAEMLAAVARMLSSALTTGDVGPETRLNLVRLLDGLQIELRERGREDSQSIRNALTELEGLLKLLVQRRSPPEPAVPKNLLGETRGEGNEGLTARKAQKENDGLVANPPHAGEHANSVRQFDRLTREIQRSLERFGAAKIQRSPIEPERPARPIGVKSETAQGVNPAEFAQMRAQTEAIRNLLSAQAAMLAESLESQRHARLASDDLGSAAKEILELLKNPSRDDSVREIELRLDTLTRKAEEAIGKAGHEEEALSAQIDAAHQHLAARLDAGLAAASIEMGALKDLVRDFAGAVEPPPNPPQPAMDELGQEIAKLAERLDRVGEGFEQLQTTAPTPLNGHGMSFDDAQGIMREIADLRALQDETGRRAHLVLASVQESVAQVAERLAKLENSLGEMQADRPRSPLGRSSADPFAPFFAFLAERRPDGGNPNMPARKSEKPLDDRARGAAQPKTENRLSDDKLAADADAFLIEPGLGYPGRAGNSEPQGQGSTPKLARDREEGTSRAEFIAAARRAARTAQIDLHDARADSLAQDDLDPDLHPGYFRLSLKQLRLYKRPAAWSVAVLFVALGAYAIAQTLTHLSDVAPNFLKQFGNEAHVESSSPTARDGNSPKGQVPKNQAVGNQESGNHPAQAGSTTAIGAYLNPSQLVPPNGSGSAPGAVLSAAAPKSAARIIAGGEAIVNSTIGQSGAAGKAPPRSSVTQVLANVLPFASLPPIPSVSSESRPAKTLAEQAEAGDAAAQFELAVRFAEGKDGPPNYGLAAQWYDKAAQQGFAAAEYRLASLYERGFGVGKDMQRAKALYQRAAEKGNIRAMHNLGVLAAEGTDGKPDYAAAALWFGKAADFGVRDSQYNLAVLLARGLGVSKDLVRSYTWFAVVAAAGDEDAGKKRDDIAARLTSTELAAANALVVGFKPRPADRAANESTVPEWTLEAAPAQPETPKVSGL